MCKVDNILAGVVKYSGTSEVIIRLIWRFVMIAKSMVDYVKGSSVIRAMFEEGKQMAARYGA